MQPCQGPALSPTAGINVQSPQSESTPRNLTLIHVQISMDFHDCEREANKITKTYLHTCFRWILFSVKPKKCRIVSKIWIELALSMSDLESFGTRKNEVEEL